MQLEVLISAFSAVNIFTLYHGFRLPVKFYIVIPAQKYSFKLFSHRCNQTKKLDVSKEHKCPHILFFAPMATTSGCINLTTIFPMLHLI